MSVANPKFCKDCKWAFPTETERSGFFVRRPVYRWATCPHPDIAQTETAFLVTGDNSKAPSCSSQRYANSNSPCGLEAKLFEAGS